MKLGLQDASAWSFLWLWALLAASVLSAWLGAEAFRRGVGFLLRRELLLRVLTAGFLMQVAYQAAFFLAIFYGMSPGLLAIVLALQPVFSAFLAREKYGVWGQSILLLGFVGVGIAVAGARELGGVSPQGAILAVLAVLASSGGSVLQKAVKDVDLRVVAALQYFLGLFVFSGVLLWQGWQVDWTVQFIAALGWQSILVSVVGMLLYLNMLATNPVARVNSLLYLVPVLTIGFDAWVFDQAVSLITAFGMFLVLGSVFLFRRIGSVQ